MTSEIPLHIQKLQQDIQKLKKDLLKWEKRFEEKHGRKPCLRDIKERPSIEYGYKKYNYKKKELAQTSHNGSVASTSEDRHAHSTSPASSTAAEVQSETGSSPQPPATVTFEHSLHHPLSPHRSKVRSAAFSHTHNTRNASDAKLDRTPDTAETGNNTVNYRGVPPSSPTKRRQRDYEALDDKPAVSRRRLSKNDPIVCQRKAKLADILPRPPFRPKGKERETMPKYNAQQRNSGELLDKTTHQSPLRSSFTMQHSYSSNKPTTHETTSCQPDTDFGAELELEPEVEPEQRPPNSPLTNRQRQLLNNLESTPNSPSQHEFADISDNLTNDPSTSPQSLSPSKKSISSPVRRIATVIHRAETLRNAYKDAEMSKNDQDDEDLENEAFWLDISVEELRRRKSCGEPLLGSTHKNDT